MTTPETITYPFGFEPEKYPAFAPPSTNHHNLTQAEKIHDSHPWTVQQTVEAFNYCRYIVCVFDEDYSTQTVFTKRDPRVEAGVEQTDVEGLLAAIVQRGEITQVFGEYWPDATPPMEWMS
jgi:hypothetical protein